MNNPLVTTAVGWETRNTKRTLKAAAWCQDYGLSPLTATLFIGNLKAKERKSLLERFQNAFTKSTERYILLSLCKSCYEHAQFSRTHKGVIEFMPFEIVG